MTRPTRDLILTLLAYLGAALVVCSPALIMYLYVQDLPR